LAERPSPVVPVSWGELLDKIAILEIKAERLTGAEARANVARELAALGPIGAAVLGEPGIATLRAELKAVNAALWEVEDAIRVEEARGAFGPEFVALARSVYRRNDERAAVKRRINVALRSELVEEKGYSAG